MNQADIQNLFDHIKLIDDATPVPQFPCEALDEETGSICLLPDKHGGLHCAALVSGDRQWAYAVVWK